MEILFLQARTPKKLLKHIIVDNVHKYKIYKYININTKYINIKYIDGVTNELNKLKFVLSPCTLTGHSIGREHLSGA